MVCGIGMEKGKRRGEKLPLLARRPRPRAYGRGTPRVELRVALRLFRQRVEAVRRRGAAITAAWVLQRGCGPAGRDLIRGQVFANGRARWRPHRRVV